MCVCVYCLPPNNSWGKLILMHPTQTVAQLLQNIVPVIPSQLDRIHNLFVTGESGVGRYDVFARQMIKILNSHLFHWFFRLDLL